MKLSINNVAKVRKAEIEIDGITVIAGYNGTGKSTVCKALYSVCTAYRNLNERVDRARNDSIENCLEEWDRERKSEEAPFYWSTLPMDFFEKIQEKEIVLENITEEQLADIVEIKQGDDGNLGKLYDSLRTVIDRPFAVYAEFVIERLFHRCFNGQLNSLNNPDEANIRLKDENFEIAVTILENRLMQGQSTVKQVKVGNPVYIETNSYLDMLMVERRRRSGNSKIPLSALFKSKEDRMTLEKYQELDKANTICAQIIKEVTHGELVPTSNKEIIYKEEDIRENIVCGNIASGLKNVLLIQRMLDNGFLNSNSILLIDEPEVNLHPEWQVKFAEILVLLNKELGIKMVLNTHSPYFMRAIESKMADHEIADKGRYYFMEKAQGGKNEYISKDVTGSTELVYETMYRPLENL